MIRRVRDRRPGWIGGRQNPRSLGEPPGTEDNVANVEGREAAPPNTGFGQRWRKDLTIVIPGAPGAEELMTYWRTHLHDLWPEHGDLYIPHRGIQSGELVGIDIEFGPMTLSTGVVVAASSPTSFTLQSPQGHAFAGSNRFHTSNEAEGGTLAGVSIEMRASDPFYELGLMLGGHRVEERFWADHLQNLAERFDAGRPKVRLVRRRADRRRQWRYATNIRYNAAIRTTLRRIGRVFGVGR